jgi:hypothetical protein
MQLRRALLAGATTLALLSSLAFTKAAEVGVCEIVGNPAAFASGWRNDNFIARTTCRAAQAPALYFGSMTRRQLMYSLEYAVHADVIAVIHSSVAPNEYTERSAPAGVLEFERGVIPAWRCRLRAVFALPHSRLGLTGAIQGRRLVFPEVLEPIGCQSRIAHGGHD